MWVLCYFSVTFLPVWLCRAESPSQVQLPGNPCRQTQGQPEAVPAQPSGSAGHGGCSHTPSQGSREPPRTEDVPRTSAEAQQQPCQGGELVAPAGAVDAPGFGLDRDNTRWEHLEHPPLPQTWWLRSRSRVWEGLGLLQPFSHDLIEIMSR